MARTTSFCAISFVCTSITLDKAVPDAIGTGTLASDRVIEAMSQVDRAHFVDPSFAELAYEDRPVPIIGNQTISAPHMVCHVARWLLCLTALARHGARVPKRPNLGGLQSARRGLGLRLFVSSNGSHGGRVWQCANATCLMSISLSLKVFGIEFIPELAQVGKRNAMRAVPHLFEQGVLSIAHGGALSCIRIGATSQV